MIEFSSEETGRNKHNYNFSPIHDFFRFFRFMKSKTIKIQKQNEKKIKGKEMKRNVTKKRVRKRNETEKTEKIQKLGLSKPVAIFKTGFSVFKNSKTGTLVLKPVLKFLMNN
jgi:hypothetical protein